MIKTTFIQDNATIHIGVFNSQEENEKAIKQYFIANIKKEIIDENYNIEDDTEYQEFFKNLNIETLND